MNSALRCSFFGLLAFLAFFNTNASANLVFTMTASQNTLEVSETAVIGLWGEVEEQATGLNGINLWQLDMVVDTDNVIQVTNVEILQPAGDEGLDPFVPEYIYINDENGDFFGDVLGMGGAALNPPSPSSVGVGGPTLLANITIEAIGVGQATYDLAGDTAGNIEVGSNGCSCLTHLMIFNQNAGIHCGP